MVPHSMQNQGMTSDPNQESTEPQNHPKTRRRMSPLGLTLTLSIAFFFVFVLATGYLVRKDLGGGAKGAAGKKIFAGGRQKVGVLEISGVIREGPAKRWLKTLKGFEKDENVKAIVIRVNSPGGAVAPSQELYNEIGKVAAKKPVVTSMASVAASGGYYVAVATPMVFANPGTITGSIGVIMEFANLEKLYDWAKVQRFSIKTGKFKDAGAEYRTMAPEERQLLQGMIDSTLVDFKAAVAKGRKMSLTEVDAVADGRIFSGSQALAARLVDRLGGLQEAIDEAAKQGKIEGEPKVVYEEKKKRGLIEYLIEEGSDRDRDEDSRSSLAGGEGFKSAIAELARDVLGIPKAKVALEPGVYWLLPWGY